MTIDQVLRRQAFEEHIEERWPFQNTERHPEADYKDKRTQCDWVMWQECWDKSRLAQGAQT